MLPHVLSFFSPILSSLLFPKWAPRLSLGQVRWNSTRKTHGWGQSKGRYKVVNHSQTWPLPFPAQGPPGGYWFVSRLQGLRRGRDGVVPSKAGIDRLDMRTTRELLQARAHVRADPGCICHMLTQEQLVLSWMFAPLCWRGVPLYIVNASWLCCWCGREQEVGFRYLSFLILGWLYTWRNCEGHKCKKSHTGEDTWPVAILAWEYPSLDLRSQAGSGVVNTWMGVRLAILGAVG